MKIVFSKMTGGLLLFTLLVSLKVNASLPQAKNDSVFHLVQPDYKLSPLTGRSDAFPETAGKELSNRWKT